MKFGKNIKRLANPSHLAHYIAYDILKKAITVVVEGGQQQRDEDIREIQETFGQTSRSICRPPDSRFHDLLQHELTKVNRFAALALRTLLDKLKEALNTILKCPETEGPDREALLNKAESWLETAVKELVSFEQFRRINFTGFRKIVKKFDKRWLQEGGSENGALASWFVPTLMREFFVAAPLDAYLLGLSLGYAILRRLRRRSATSLTAAPQSTTTRTFWLGPGYRINALCTLLKRFELVTPGPHAGAALVPGAKAVGPESTWEALVDRMRRLLKAMGSDGVAASRSRLAMETTMVYFDLDADFPTYKQRIEPGTRVHSGFRCRRSSCVTVAGPGTGGGAVLEKDGAASALGAHALTPVAEILAPDAFPMEVGHGEDPQGAKVLAAAQAAQGALGQAEAPFAALGPGEEEELRQFLAEVEAFASTPAFLPMATVSCSRVLLKGDTQSTQGILMAIDEDIQFSHGPAAIATKSVDFPYCLLEVACESENSKWLEELHGLGIIRDVPGFGIGAQAVAALHKDRLPALPDWYEHLKNQENEMAPESLGLLNEFRVVMNEETEEGGGAVASSSAAAVRASAASRPAALPPAGSVIAPAPAAQAEDEEAKQLEPKNFLASERTMLEWVHTVLALAFLGVGLWRFSLQGTEQKQRLAFGLLNGQSNSSLALGLYSLTLVAISVIFVWFAVLSHLQRVNALAKAQHLEAVFNSRVVPSLFAAAVGLALVAHLGVQAIPLWLAGAR